MRARHDRHLLVVECDRRVGSFITQALRAEEYQVDWATSGKDALACARRTPPDLILLDATCAAPGDLTFARALKAEQAAPILMVTAGLKHDDAAIADLAEARLTKPFRLDELLGQVASLLAR